MFRYILLYVLANKSLIKWEDFTFWLPLNLDLTDNSILDYFLPFNGNVFFTIPTYTYWLISSSVKSMILITDNYI